MFEEEIKKIFSLEDYTIDRIKRECEYELFERPFSNMKPAYTVYDFLKLMKDSVSGEKAEKSISDLYADWTSGKYHDFAQYDLDLRRYKSSSSKFGSWSIGERSDHDEPEIQASEPDDTSDSEDEDDSYPASFSQWNDLIPEVNDNFSPVYYIDLFNGLLIHSIKENDYFFIEDYLDNLSGELGKIGVTKETTDLNKDKGSIINFQYAFSIVSIQSFILRIKSMQSEDKAISLGEEIRNRFDPILSAAFYLNLMKDQIKFAITYYFSEEKKYSLDTLYVLYWFAQLLWLYISINDSQSKKCQYSLTDGISYLSCLFADMSWESHHYQNGILFSRLALDILLPDIKQESYNLLGLSAIDSGEKQLAYDAYFSWLNRESVGEIPFTDNETTSALDEKWRKSKDGIKKEALMRSNLSYVSSMIYSGLEKGTPDRQYFYIIAKEQIEKAIELNGEEASYYCTKSSILSDSEEHKDALKSCEEYKKRSASNKQDFVSALRQCVEMQLDLMTEGVLQRGVCFDNKTNKEYSVFVEYLEEYNKAVHDEDKAEMMEEYNQWKSYQSLFNLRSYCDKNSIEVKLEYILLVIFNLSALIRQELSRSDYNYTKYFTRIPEYDDKIRGHQKEVKPIAYYTSLNTAKFLFTPIGNEYKKEAEETKPEEKKPEEKKPEEKKNCFTVMHAQYMNDPNEGLPLLNALFGNTGFNSLEVRNELYRNRFTFIKSFTESIDSFIMWNRYGRNKGGDSDGCCLQIHPMTFDELVDESRVRGEKRNDFAATLDDYHLYRIVYLSEDGTILDEHNKDLPPKIKEYYSYLRKMFEELDKELQNTNENFKAVVSDFLQYCFRYIAFLFKDAVYSSEKESRIIMLRLLDQTDLISTVSQEPPMLCVKPYFQVYINEIIFGPTCHETEKWEPYFQYSLSKMWKDFTPEEKPGKPPYTIRRSKIKYNP